MKELIVKLTPVPVSGAHNAVTSSSAATDATNSPMETEPKMTPEEPKRATEVIEIGDDDEAKEDEEKAEEAVEEEKVSTPVEEEEEDNTEDDDDEEEEKDQEPDSKRSPRVKTTPRRRPSEMSRPSIVEDSDSDEVPAVLLQTVANSVPSSDDEAAESNHEVRKKCLFGLVKTTPPCQDRKRKLKERSSSSSSSSSSSVLGVQEHKVRRTAGQPHKESETSEQETESDSDDQDQKIQPLSDVTLMSSSTFHQQSSGTRTPYHHIKMSSCL